MQKLREQVSAHWRASSCFDVAVTEEVTSLDRFEIDIIGRIFSPSESDRYRTEIGEVSGFPTHGFA